MAAYTPPAFVARPQNPVHVWVEEEIVVAAKEAAAREAAKAAQEAHEAQGGERDAGEQAAGTGEAPDAPE